MKTKRDLIAIVGIVLFVLAFAITGSYNDSISGGGDDGEDAQYKDIVDDIDETLIKTYSNVDKIEYLDAELEKHKNDLKDILDEYASLDKGIKKESIYIEEIGKEINDTRADSDKLKEKRINSFYQSRSILLLFYRNVYI